MKNIVLKPRVFIVDSLIAGFCLLSALSAYNATAQNAYFDVDGTNPGYGTTNGGTYSWDDPNWGTAGGTSATTTWPAGSTAQFAGSGSYSVTVNADESTAGIILGATGTTLTIDAAGSGDIRVTGAPQFFSPSAGSSSIVINAPIVGTGGVKAGTGNLYLYGNNTYSGGTVYGSNSAFLNFNNNNSFGTGSITWGSGFNTSLDSQGTAPITISNAVFTAAGFTNIFTGGATAPTTFSGNWTVASGGTSTFFNVGSTATISGNISGGATSIFNKAGAGILILSGQNSLTGGLTLSFGTIQAGASGIFNNISRLTLSGNFAGGNFIANGFNQTTTGTLVLAGSSEITFTGTEIWHLANSSGVAWTASRTLNLQNYNDNLFIGTDATGLTTSQLAEIEFNGTDLGDAEITSNGLIIDSVPEPSTIALGLLGSLSMLWTVRRRRAA